MALAASGEELAKPSAGEVAQRFYQTCLKLQPRGLPTEEQMPSLAPLLSAELMELLASARRQQQAFQREHPGEKPPWIEGNLFASCYEGVSSFCLGAASFNQDKASIPVYLTYREGAEEVRWIDVVVLERTGTEWRVWDIFLTAPWEFRPGPSLQAVLASE